MPPSYAAERRNEPVYVDDLEALRGRHIPPPDRSRAHRRRYEDDFVPRGPRPQRRQTYREPRYYPPSEDESPRPRHRRHREYEDDSESRRRHREEDYFSDNRYNRPRRHPRDDKPPRDRRREGRASSPKERPAKPERKESRWQKEAKEMFKEYAVPAIKAEGGKIITKQIGNFLAKQAG